ncbi:RDD family protein [Gellertiella hungarica]|uniref:Putative RDD family membrane protein YckC n=1 Tax=Gellertiella hungarica TaxID=1572859 RepID=A0A7W6J654_9HYPH|nr:RDD family protein [Gellertiella hungarica]MBB4065505.1 putative RDD family membrane protein YckC [Gellertiella hungarica]
MSDARDIYAPGAINEAAFQGTLARRVFAFLIDYFLIALLILAAGLVVFFLGIITLGLAWFIYPVLGFLVAMIYFGSTIGGANQASPGMRMMGLMLVQQSGRPIDFLTAVVHLVLFWLFNSVLTPFVLLVALFTNRNRLLHDILLGTAMADRAAYQAGY